MPVSANGGSPDSGASMVDRFRAAVSESGSVHDFLCRASVPALRVSLGVVFVWFGMLKIAQVTPIADLVGATVPFLPAEILVPGLGAFEVLLGITLLVGRMIRVACLLLIGHLAGTMLVLVMAPTVAFQNGNPLLLTLTGEFVVKNLVLIAAGLMLLTSQRARIPAGTGADLVESTSGH